MSPFDSAAASTSLLDTSGECKHDVSMSNVLVRDLPDDVHAALQRKAEQRHQSLQRYLTVELRRLAERRQLDDVLDDIEQRHGGRVGLSAAVDDLDRDRERERQ